jgi:methyl-accepting chemotaxis protein
MLKENLEPAAITLAQNRPAPSPADVRTAREAAENSRRGLETALAGGRRVVESINLLHDLAVAHAGHGRKLEALEARMDSAPGVGMRLGEIAERGSALSLRAAHIASRSRSKSLAAAADEMRRIARLTALRNREIQALLGEIRDEGKAAVRDMLRLTRVAAGARKIAGEARGGLNDVFVALSEADHDLGEIAGRLDAAGAAPDEADSRDGAQPGAMQSNCGEFQQLHTDAGESACGKGDAGLAADRFKAAGN